MSFSGVRRLFRLERADVESQIDEELRFHFERRVEELVAAGMTPEQARAEAVRAFGDVAAHRRDLARLDRARVSRAARGDAIGGLAADVRFALRALRRSPAYTALALLTLALGIGATTAVFTVVNGVLLRPLPYPAPEQLLRVQERSARGHTMAWAGANFLEARERARSLDAMGAYSDWQTTVLGADEPRRVTVCAVTGDFFRVLRTPATIGRTLEATDGEPGRPPAVVVSHAFWQHALGGAQDIGARLLRIDGTAYHVVGVMPPGFAYPADAELWFATVDDNPHRTAHNWRGIARLRDGRTERDARGELDAILADIKAREGSGSDAVGAVVSGLQADLARDARASLLLLQGAVGFVLLLACVNLASAALARSEARRRELAVRSALGAGRARLVRLLLTEHLLLALAGGTLGIVLAIVLVRTALAAAPDTLPRVSDIRIDAGVVAFAILAASLSGLLVGVLPAWQAARTDLRQAIGEGGRATGGGRLRVRALLIGAEAALALALVAGAGVLVRSLRSLLDVPPGFETVRVLTADITPPSELSKDSLRLTGYLDALVSRLEAVPGARAVALTSNAPLGTFDPTSMFYVDGGDQLVGSASYRVVSAGYFRALGIPLVRGRTFGDADGPGAPHAVVLSESAARRFWPGQDPIGHRVRFPGMDSHPTVWLTVIGVVGDVRDRGLDEPAPPLMYVSHRQRPERLAEGAQLIVRASLPPAALASAVREAVRGVDRNVPVDISSLRAALDRSTAPRRFTTGVLTSFGALSLLLAAVGIYGMLAYSVAQRRREFSVRLALGAAPGDLRRMVIGDALRPVLPGVVIGAAVALVLSRVMRGLVFGVSAADPLSFAAAAALIVAMACIASWLPAHRATRTDPTMAIRGD